MRRAAGALKARKGGGRPGHCWRLPVASGLLICIIFGTALLVGCGDPKQEAAESPTTLSRHVLQLEQGAPVESVKEQLGEPEAESTNGANGSLSYGIWQLAFVNGHLKTRSKVVVPKRSKSDVDTHIRSSVILGLHLGTKLGEVEVILGTPDVVYEIYEGQPRPVRVLRYGSWELTFENDVLTLRSQ